jgi:hypothetical protein
MDGRTYRNGYVILKHARNIELFTSLALHSSSKIILGDAYNMDSCTIYSGSGRRPHTLLDMCGIHAAFRREYYMHQPEPRPESVPSLIASLKESSTDAGSCT